eukprot:scaffold1504_cov172-Ochromonas_danica.AAC.8
MKQYGGKVWSFIDYYESCVDKAPHAMQIIAADTDESRTRQEVENLANQVASWALSEHLSQRDCCAIMLMNCVDFPSVWLGMSKVGVSAALLNTNILGLPFIQTVELSLRDSKQKILIVDESLKDKIDDELKQLYERGVRVYFWGKGSDCINQTAIIKQPTDRLPKAHRSEIFEKDPLIYIFTSGTTGLPKACRIVQSRYFLGSHFLPAICPLSVDDIFYSSLPLYHSAAGLLALGGALTLGYCFVTRKKFSASAFAADCLKYRVTSIQYIGELCRYLMASPVNETLESQLYIRVAVGNGMRSDYWTSFQTRFHVQDIVEFYSATEGNLALVNNHGRVGALGYIPLIVDSLYPVAIVKVEDETSSEPYRNADGFCEHCKPGEPGLVLSVVTQDRAFEGYTDKKATEAKLLRNVFKPGDCYFNSGDLLSRDSEGYFYWCDRVGDTFRWKGENVSTTEVMDVIAPCATVADAVVYGVSVMHMDGKAGMVTVVPTDEHDLDFDDFTKVIKANLPVYARPMFLRLKKAGEKLPLTTTFKYLKGGLIRDGYDINATYPDKLFYYDVKSDKYAELTDEISIVLKDGKIRF